jgi:rhodanese-related sulfurtransferase
VGLWEQKPVFNVLRLAAATVVLLLSVTAAPAAEAPIEIKGAKTLDAKGVIDVISTTPDIVIIDNRHQADFEAGHIEGAVRILDTDLTEELLARVVKSKASPVLFYCNGVKCGRAAVATVKALGWGYSAVYYYADGIHDWKANQLPLVTQ